MPVSHSPEFLAALAEFNEGVRRSRRAYRQHPFASLHLSPHDYRCLAEGCPGGYEWAEKRRPYMREVMRKRRLRRVA